MEQTKTNWRNDPRLKGMNPQKLDLLVSFSQQIANMPKNKLLSAFMEFQMETQKRGFQFSDQETAILAAILTEHLSEGDRKKLDTLRLLSQKLSRQT
ncbi:MAG: hypothetical protein HFG51_10000 [Lachnospiraceae bacterium]|nr:hypothetical protein [Lachnospiraceae bacterium]